MQIILSMHAYFKKLIPCAMALILWTISAPAAASLCSKAFVESPSSGITGTSIHSTDPFGLLPEGHFQVTIVTRLPTQPTPTSDISWLRNQKSLSLVQSLLNQGVPLVTGKIPDGTTADAFVLPSSYQLTQDVLNAKKDKVHKNILFLQAHASIDVIEHELQHWNDYETGMFDEFMSELQKFARSAHLANAEFIAIQDAVVEQRGHARQQQSLLAQGFTKASIEVSGVSTNYQHYAEALLPIFNHLEKKAPTQSKALVALLNKFELHIEGAIQFESLLPYWMTRQH